MVGMEFGTTPVLSEVAEDHGSTGMSASGELHVSSDQERSMEFGCPAVSNVDVCSVWEIPKNAFG